METVAKRMAHASFIQSHFYPAQLLTANWGHKPHSPDLPIFQVSCIIWRSYEIS